MPLVWLASKLIWSKFEWPLYNAKWPVASCCFVVCTTTCMPAQAFFRRLPEYKVIVMRAYRYSFMRFYGFPLLLTRLLMDCHFENTFMVLWGFQLHCWRMRPLCGPYLRYVSIHVTIMRPCYLPSTNSAAGWSNDNCQYTYAHMYVLLFLWSTFVLLLLHKRVC